MCNVYWISPYQLFWMWWWVQCDLAGRWDASTPGVGRWVECKDPERGGFHWWRYPQLAGWFIKKKHRSKWMMTGDSPMTSETTISRVSASYFTKNMFHLSESSVSSWRFLLTQHFTWPWAAGGCRCARGRKSVQPLSPGFGMVCSGCKKWSRGYCGSRRVAQTSFNVRCDGEASG